ncbi:MAG: Ig-like domain-containing protein [Candidatus Eisenbacteria bacterium]
MRPCRSRLGLLAVAGALAISGCSGHAGGRAGVTEQHSIGLRLTPDPANASARIAVVFDDPHLQPAQCRYEWRRNGSLIADASTDGLDPTHFSKNDQIAVAVSAPDPAGGAVRTLTASVLVVNTPPKVVRVTLAFSTPSGAPEIQANVESVDPDGDAPTYTYRWLKDGAPIADASGSSLPLTHLARGDRVTVEVVARDDVSSSLPVRSEPMALDNRPPVFSSQPYAPRPTDVDFRYQATATDPDGDPLHYDLVDGPPGMLVDSSGSVYWLLPTGSLRHGDYPVRIRATDSKGGEATQDFTVHLDSPSAK